MDRRVLGCLLSGVSLVIATGVVSVIVAISWWMLYALLHARYPSLDHNVVRVISVGAPLLVGVLLLALWQVGVLLFATSFAQRAVASAQEGRFLEASERLRMLRNLEPWLRLGGMGGGAWARLRVAESYAYALHGLSDEAARMALEEAQFPWRPSLSRAAAAVAAIAATDSADPATWTALEKHLIWAEGDGVSPNAQTLLACRGMSRALALDLEGASRDAALLESKAPEGRAAAGLRGAIAFWRGQWADADRELLRSRSTPPAGHPDGAPIPANANHGVDAQRIELAREMGDAPRALALTEALAAEKPTHRSARIVIACVRGEQGSPDSALLELESIAAQWPFSPATLASVAFARSRVEKARGNHAGALSALAPALSSPHLAVRQLALLEAGDACAAQGDPETARRRWSEAIAFGTPSSAGARAASR